MEDLVGPTKKSTGLGKSTRKKLGFTDKARLSLIAVNLLMIAVTLGLINRLLNFWERRQKSKKSIKHRDIIDVIPIEKENNYD